jgi:hypothetical protein
MHVCRFAVMKTAGRSAVHDVHHVDDGSVQVAVNIARIKIAGDHLMLRHAFKRAGQIFCPKGKAYGLAELVTAGGGEDVGAQFINAPVCEKAGG